MERRQVAVERGARDAADDEVLGRERGLGLGRRAAAAARAAAATAPRLRPLALGRRQDVLDPLEPHLVLRRALPPQRLHALAQLPGGPARSVQLVELQERRRGRGGEGAVGGRRRAAGVAVAVAVAPLSAGERDGGTPPLPPAE